MTQRGKTADVQIPDNVDRLWESIEDIRASVSSLAARFGEQAVAIGDRRVRQATEVAGEFAEGFADRAGERAVALRDQIESRPVGSAAIAFFAGVAVAGLVMGVLFSASQSEPRRPNRNSKRLR